MLGRQVLVSVAADETLVPKVPSIISLEWLRVMERSQRCAR